MVSLICRATRLSDGASVAVEVVNHGIQPAFDANGNAYEAYATEFRVDGKSIEWLYVPKRLAEKYGNISEFRLSEDIAAIEGLGFEPESLELVKG